MILIFNKSMSILILIILIIFFSHPVQCDEDKLEDKLEDKVEEGIVQLPNGNKLIGRKERSFYAQKPYLEFRGIPFAKPPKGPLRFKPPQAYTEKWIEPLRATEYGAACPQVDILGDDRTEAHVEDVLIIGDEDCLFINVAVPFGRTLKGSSPFPVAVWIHGGSFQYESGDAYGLSKFLDHDIIFVTFNYRVGVLGFLQSDPEEDTEGSIIQGNMGLKDQTLALKWIQTNIEAFGGDPGAVTLLGVNSGAVSAHLHLLSPFSKDLFHRAYLQSGSALAPWAVTRTNVANKFGKWMNCSVSVVQCLMDADWKDIIRKQQRLTEWFIDPLVPVGPSVEISDREGPKFLSQDPYTILASGDFWAKDKVSITMGINSHEGLLHAVDIVHHPTLYTVLNMEWARAAPISLMLRESIPEEGTTSLTSLAFKIKEYYFGEPIFLNKQKDKPKEEKEDKPKKKHPLKMPFKFIAKDFHQFEELTKMYSDRYFNVPLHVGALLHAKGQEAAVYVYYFSYTGTQSTSQMSGYNETIFGVAHYDQIQYMFETPYFKPVSREEDIIFAKRFVAGIVRFIALGEPMGGDWTKVTPEMVEESVPLIYNRIGSPKDAYQLIEPFTKAVDFWLSLPLLEFGKTQEQIKQEEKEIKDKQKDEL